MRLGHERLTVSCGGGDGGECGVPVSSIRRFTFWFVKREEERAFLYSVYDTTAIKPCIFIYQFVRYINLSATCQTTETVVWKVEKNIIFRIREDMQYIQYIRAYMRLATQHLAKDLTMYPDR